MAQWRHAASGRREVVGREGHPPQSTWLGGLPWRVGQSGQPREALVQVREDLQAQDPMATPARGRKGEGTGELGTGRGGD